MPSRFPWQRPQPTASGSTNPSYASPSNPYANAYASNPPASSGTTTARDPNSPAIGLVAESPNQLRARVNSPHNRAVPDVFQNDNRAYPSPSAAAAGPGAGKRVVSFLKRKKKDEDSPQGWQQLPDDSPGPRRGAAGVGGVKRYDARGYPERAGNDVGSPLPGLSPENKRYLLRTSRSHDSLASEVSSTGAGVNEESGRFLSSSNRPTSYYASSDAPTVHPVMDYSLSAPSYDPNHANGKLEGTGYVWKSGGANGGPEPAQSLYAQSMMSVQTRTSDTSMTHFKKHEHVSDSYGAFSISSKGGKKHLGNNVSVS